jgi:hypothetical protein
LRQPQRPKPNPSTIFKFCTPQHNSNPINNS